MSIPVFDLVNLQSLRAVLRIWFIECLIQGQETMVSTDIDMLDPPGNRSCIGGLQAWTQGFNPYRHGR